MKSDEKECQVKTFFIRQGERQTAFCVAPVRPLQTVKNFQTACARSCTKEPCAFTRTAFGLFLPEQEFHCHAVALKAEALEGLLAGHAGIGDMAKGFPCVYIGQMHLNGGKSDSFERV